MNPVDFSIVIPHFNNCSDLGRLLSSIPQSERFQVIVVDDYSSDVCFNEVKALKDAYNFELHRNTGKKSAGTCRNIGLRKSCGKCVLFADSDDFFLKGWEKEVYKFLDSGNDIVFFPPTSVYNDTFEESDRHLSHAHKLFAYLNAPTLKNEFALRLSWNCPWSKLYRLSFLRDNGICFDEVIATNDAMFSLKSGVAARKIQISTQPIYCCVARRGSLEHLYTREILEARIRVGMKHLLECEKIGFGVFGDNALEWFYRVRFLNFRDQLYLIKIAKKIGLLKRLSLLTIISRLYSSFFRKKKEINTKKDNLIVIK